MNYRFYPLISLYMIVMLLSQCAYAEIIQQVQQNYRDPEVQSLVDDAVNYFIQEGPERACVSFLHDTSWWLPNVKLFVINPQNQTMLIDHDYHRIWNNSDDFKTLEGELLVPQLRKDNHEGGWFFTFWNNDLTYLCMRKVEASLRAPHSKPLPQTLDRGSVQQAGSQARSYYVGALFFKQSPRNEVMELVFTIRLFLLKNGINAGVQHINNPLENTQRGSLTVALYDSNGICLADSFTSAFVGRATSAWVDDTGKSVFKSFLEATNNDLEQGWVETVFNGLQQRNFVIKIRNPVNNSFYILVSGYYPQITKKYVMSLGVQAANLIASNGEKAFDELSMPRGSFNKGRLSVVVFDEKGAVKANSAEPMIIGSSLANYRDQLNAPLVQQIINLALKKEKAWWRTYKHGLTEMIYCQKVEFDTKTYIVTVRGFTPFTQASIALALAELGYSFLDVLPTMQAYRILNNYADLSAAKSFNPYGNMFAEVYHQGFCVAQSRSPDYRFKLWSSFDDGIRQRVEALYKAGQSQGWLRYDRDDIPRRVYLRLGDTARVKEYVVLVAYDDVSRAERK